MSEWPTFLQTEACEIPYLAQSETRVTDLSHWGVLATKGPDTLKFLQGQLSCDVLALGEGKSSLGAHCTHQGKILSCFRAFHLDSDHLALTMPLDILENATAALAKYIVFSKADISDLSLEYCGIGLAGPEAAKLIEDHLGACPNSVNDLMRVDQAYVTKVSEQRYECWLSPAAAIDFWRDLAPHCRKSTHNDWALLSIRDGIPELHEQTTDTFIPQMLNLQLIGGVSFQKGCYTGQEVVARMEFRGKLKRPMYRLGFTVEESEALPEPGTPIFCADKKQSVGNIVIAARADNQKAEALAVLTSVTAEAANAFLDAEKLKKLNILSLPYSIKSEH